MLAITTDFGARHRAVARYRSASTRCASEADASQTRTYAQAPRQWQGYLYKLPLQTYAAPKVQTAAWSPDLRSGQAAKSALTRPQSLRHKPSIEPSYEPSHSSTASVPAERVAAFQKKQEGTEVVQNRIAGRIGGDGWLVLGEMSDSQRAHLSTLERQGRLDDETLTSAVLAVRIKQQR